MNNDQSGDINNPRHHLLAVFGARGAVKIFDGK